MSDPHAHASGHAHSELDADEPHTPMWLPLLGGLLFLGAAIFALATSDGESTANTEAGTPKVAATIVPPGNEAPTPAPTAPRFNVRRVPDENIQRVQPGTQPPGQPGNPAVRPVPPSPEGAARLAPQGAMPKRPEAPQAAPHPHPHPGE